MIKLSNFHEDNKTGKIRCEPLDRLSKFLFKHKDAGVTSHVLSFLGEKRGYGDLRNATKQKLHAVAVEKDAPCSSYSWWRK